MFYATTTTLFFGVLSYSCINDADFADNAELSSSILIFALFGMSLFNLMAVISG